MSVQQGNENQFWFETFSPVQGSNNHKVKKRTSRIHQTIILLFQKLGYNIVKSTKFQGLVCKLPKLNKSQLYRTKKQCPANWSLDISNGSFLNLSTRGKHLLFFSCDFKHNLENYCALQEKKSNHWID